MLKVMSTVGSAFVGDEKLVTMHECIHSNHVNAMQCNMMQFNSKQKELTHHKLQLQCKIQDRRKTFWCHYISFCKEMKTGVYQVHHLANQYQH